MNPIKAIVTYVRSSIAELKKVTWPSRDTTFRYSVLVIIVSVAVATFFATLDFGFSKAIRLLIAQKPTAAPPADQVPTVPDLSPSDIMSDVTGEGDAAETTITTEPTEGEVELEPSFDEVPSSDFELPPIE